MTAPPVWPTTHQRGRFAPPPAVVRPTQVAPPAVRPPNGQQTTPMPTRHLGKPVQTAPVPAARGVAPAPVPATQPRPARRALPSAKLATSPVPAVPIKVAGTAMRDNAERRIDRLRGQIRQDGETLANAVLAIVKRISEGALPPQAGEVVLMAHGLDQNFASLHELMRLTQV